MKGIAVYSDTATLLESLELPGIAAGAIACNEILPWSDVGLTFRSTGNMPIANLKLVLLGSERGGELMETQAITISTPSSIFQLKLDEVDISREIAERSSA